MSTTTLPPTPRDFDIHRMSLVMHISTWRIAEKHGISQTRVRQVIQRVSHWLAATVPVKTELEQEQETRLAQHLAADQMRQQIETLQNYWDGSADPKYLRHQTRVIAALARLGVVPGTIEAVAADATIGPYDPSEPQAPWSEDDPWANSTPQSARVPVGERSSTTAGRSERPADGTSTSSSFINQPSSFASPPSGDFSAASDSQPLAAAPAAATKDATAASSTTSAPARSLAEDTLDGLNYMEKNLLRLIENTPPANTEKLNQLQQSLAELRASKAKYEVRIAPHIVGAQITIPQQKQEKREQEETEVTEASPC